ncbi:hypothetical protein L1987_09353 [Smallanthus sonchifolius]|uniref:Uncharacterized protein n=1 Tax=Smallanthus sonchifolius TaxID=185202 RepID=A0ACB9JNQ5_9ASTR|nr:hypothetical protein L1987_09353 [Smallanthus sonchifolius]
MVFCEVSRSFSALEFLEHCFIDFWLYFFGFFGSEDCFVFERLLGSFSLDWILISSLLIIETFLQWSLLKLEEEGIETSGRHFLLSVGHRNYLSVPLSVEGTTETSIFCPVISKLTLQISHSKLVSLEAGKFRARFLTRN